jgi:hypothetical protein
MRLVLHTAAYWLILARIDIGRRDRLLLLAQRGERSTEVRSEVERACPCAAAIFIRSLAFSPIMIAAAFVFELMIDGNDRTVRDAQPFHAPDPQLRSKSRGRSVRQGSWDR